MTDEHGGTARGAASYDVRWADIWIGSAVAVAATALLTPAVLLVDENVWWVSLVAALAVGAGAGFAGLRARQVEPLNGALVMAVIFVVEATVLLVGEATEWLPEPLPGLPVGDSTFFFVSPLIQLAFAVAGSLVGGAWATRAHGSERGRDIVTFPDDDGREGQ